MTIALAALTIAIRFFSPHYLFEALMDRPLVPATTALMILVTAVGLLRKKESIRLLPHMFVPWVLLGWTAVCVVLNTAPEVRAAGVVTDATREGVGTIRGLLTGDLVKDLIYITTLMIIIDRLSRLKVVLGVVMAVMMVIGVLALPQTWGDKYCGEFAEGDLSNLVLDNRRCQESMDCFINEPKTRAFAGVGPRNWRCERKGLFNIAAYLDRIRWVGVFDDSNNLGSTVAMMLSFVIGWLWGRPGLRRKALGAAVALFFAAMIFATGSRGAQLCLVVGAGITLWLLWGKKVIIFGGMLALAVGLLVVVGGKMRVRDETSYQGSTKVSDRYRRDAMKVGFDLWKRYPVFGVGYQRFEEYNVIDPHNAYLDSVSEVGTLGLLIFAFGVWLNFRGVMQVRRKAREAGHLELTNLSSGMIGGMLSGWIGLTFFLSTWDALSWLMTIPYCTGLVRAAERELPGFRYRFDPWDVLFFLPAVFLLMGVFYLGLMASFTMS